VARRQLNLPPVRAENAAFVGVDAPQLAKGQSENFEKCLLFIVDARIDLAAPTFFVSMSHLSLNYGSGLRLLCFLVYLIRTGGIAMECGTVWMLVAYRNSLQICLICFLPSPANKNVHKSSTRGNIYTTSSRKAYAHKTRSM
jgi:hypothetical protein